MILYIDALKLGFDFSTNVLCALRINLTKIRVTNKNSESKDSLFLFWRSGRDSNPRPPA